MQVKKDVKKEGGENTTYFQTVPSLPIENGLLSMIQTIQTDNNRFIRDDLMSSIDTMQDSISTIQDSISTIQNTIDSKSNELIDVLKDIHDRFIGSINTVNTNIQKINDNMIIIDNNQSTLTNRIMERLENIESVLNTIQKGQKNNSKKFLFW